MWTPSPSRRVVSSATATLLHLLFAGAADAAPPLVGVSPQDEAYFATQVIACRDGSGSFPRIRLNDGYCDCADGTDEPGTSACPEGKFYCRNIGDTPRLLFSSFVNDKICDCCDGSDEYESGIHCQNTCRNRKDIDEAADGGGELSVTRLDATNEFTTKHTIGIENLVHNNINKDLMQKLRGLRMALVMELGLVCIFAFCIARRHTRTRRRQHILKHKLWSVFPSTCSSQKYFKPALDLESATFGFPCVWGCKWVVLDHSLSSFYFHFACFKVRISSFRFVWGQ